MSGELHEARVAEFGEHCRRRGNLRLEIPPETAAVIITQLRMAALYQARLPEAERAPVEPMIASTRAIAAGLNDALADGNARIRHMIGQELVDPTVIKMRRRFRDRSRRRAPGIGQGGPAASGGQPARRCDGRAPESDVSTAAPPTDVPPRGWRAAWHGLRLLLSDWLLSWSLGVAPQPEAAALAEAFLEYHGQTTTPELRVVHGPEVRHEAEGQA